MLKGLRKMKELHVLNLWKTSVRGMMELLSICVEMKK